MKEWAARRLKNITEHLVPYLNKKLQDVFTGIIQLVSQFMCTVHNREEAGVIGSFRGDCCKLFFIKYRKG
jgi:hypothetical protein